MAPQERRAKPQAALRSRYRRLTPWNKLSVWADIAAIASVMVTIVTTALVIALDRLDRPPVRPMATNPLTVESEWHGSANYMDITTALGCMGSVDVIDVSTRPANMAWEEASKQSAALGSALVQFSLLPDVAAGEYVSVRELTVHLTSYEPPARNPALLTAPGACVSHGPNDSNLDFRAVLTPQTRSVELFRPAASPMQLGALAVRSDEPRSIRISVMAREHGWYRGNIALSYWYRGTERTIGAGEFAFYLPPTGAHTAVYAIDWSRDDEAYVLLGEQDANEFVESLNDLGMVYPPRPISPAVRSGFVGYRETVAD